MFKIYPKERFCTPRGPLIHPSKRAYIEASLCFFVYDKIIALLLNRRLAYFA